ncbi:Piso0_002079 [Millerozyma farinosa CBS 7064]|uniref:Piso0_002079 protein n=1 Tax=Pichia sorbitophila (strain ATCC MYA-4447 / BCRC 22081 / CBS 7064 / NBRC 10061 / NRRL Y-12695) TaxID=559304 RepID=G8YBM5_PICSO|nr:Piso0_002079 [Millerozyma farinosa CBS 7064]
MTTPHAVPITVPATKKMLMLQQNGGANGYLQHNLIGSGFQGPDIMLRIKMCLKSGIESEIDWALVTLSQISCTSPSLVNLEKSRIIGDELINFFKKPFQILVEDKTMNITPDIMSRCLDSLLTLRNLAQDLINQQWLSQSKTLKRYLIDAMKFYIYWFYSAKDKSQSLRAYHDQFREGLNYVIDILDPLSCYYVDNTKNDPLFNQLLVLLNSSDDKYLLIGIIKSLTHLLFLKKGDSESEKEKDDGEKEENEVLTTKCIDALEDAHLSKILNYLLVGDNDLVFVSLSFIKEYLLSEAIHPSSNHSISESQSLRLAKLLQLHSSKAGAQILMKTLPSLIISGLPLISPADVSSMPAPTLSKRSQYVSVPSVLPDLSKQLYDIIVRFPEPLRATTWLRCCYEPFSGPQTTDPHPESSDTIPGEVTQISLWKAYEKQFEEVWQSSKNQPNLEFPPLLPAVDFIKNVSSAFPNSEAMVVNIPSENPDQPSKKKFIIKGIQPRQFVVNIDVGNYEALKRNPLSSSDPNSESNPDVFDLPVGHVDIDKFRHSIDYVNDIILSSSLKKDSKSVSAINLLSHDILSYIIQVLFRRRDSKYLQDIFRVYNYWLPEMLYANPSLLDAGFIELDWLAFLL